MAESWTVDKPLIDRKPSPNREPVELKEIVTIIGDGDGGGYREPNVADNESHTDEKMSEEDFIKSKFHMKVLSVPEDEAIADESRTECATNAFGNIAFRCSYEMANPPVTRTSSQYTSIISWITSRRSSEASQIAKFVRASDHDCMHDLLHLMTEKSYWALPPPKLIVSIQGGAKRFHFTKTRIDSIFQKGLLDIANLTGAWIVTPAMNVGVSKMVGDAVKDYKESHGAEVTKNIILLGITSWDYVANKEQLVNKSGSAHFQADYEVAQTDIARGSAPLNPEHSHFIIVDAEKPEGITWRIKFENFLSNRMEESFESAEQQVLRLRRKIHHIGGDSNSLFESVANQLTDDTSAKQLCQQTCNHGLENLSKYAELFDGSAEEFKHQLGSLKLNGIYQKILGDVLPAILSDLLGIKITVIRNYKPPESFSLNDMEVSQNSESIRRPSENTAVKDGKAIVIVQSTAGTHYDSTHQLADTADVEKLTAGDAHAKAHIPIVTLLVNGGDGALRGCAQSLQARTPVPLVAIAGSGRAADVLVSLHQLFQVTEPTDEDISAIYKKVMGNEPDPEALESLRVIAEHHEKISVFDRIKPGLMADEIELDSAILSAIASDGGVAKRKAQLQLALDWNRVDHARDNILNKENPDYNDLVKDKEFAIFLQDLAFEALLKDMPEFFALFMEHGLEPKKFVTEARLESLYRKSMERDDAFSAVIKDLFRSKISQKRKQCGYLCCNACDCGLTPTSSYMKKVGRIFMNLLDDNYPNIYNTQCAVFSDVPTKHLFLWAILFNRLDAAKMFWICAKDHIAGAVVGTAILKSLKKGSKYIEGDDLAISYGANALKMEDWAMGVLDQCWADKRNYHSDMLIQTSAIWGDSDMLSLAYNAKMERFVAHPACYTKLKKVWRGDIALSTPSLWIFLFAFTWPLPILMWFLTFEDEKSILRLRFSKKRRKDNEIHWWEAFWKTSWSPIILCIHYAMFNVSFLIVFSLFLMHELRPMARNKIAAIPLTAAFSNITNTTIANEVKTQLDTCLTCIPNSIGHLERVTYAFVIIIFLEEIRQIQVRFNRKKGDLFSRLAHWFSEFWNKIDMLCFALFVWAIYGRFFYLVDWYLHVRFLYCCALTLFFIRFCQIFLVVRRLGPKITMIKKMMADLLIFIFILLLINCIFGIVMRSVLDPELPLDARLVRKVFYRSYFMMFGELFLEEFDTGPEGYWWLIAGIYLLLTSIMLLNLLIAMFSYRFQQVQDRADTLYKYNFYALVYEHYDRRHLLLFGTIYQIIRNWTLRCFNKGRGINSFSEGKKSEQTTSFVERSLEKWLLQESELESESLLSHSSKGLSDVLEHLDDLRGDVGSFNLRRSLPSMDSMDGKRSNLSTRIAKLEDEFSKMAALSKSQDEKLTKVLELMQRSD